MPTSQRIETTLNDLAERIKDLDDSVGEIVGPVYPEVNANDDGDIDESEETEELESEEDGDPSEDQDGNDLEEHYFLLVESGSDNYYIAASTKRNFMTVVYPYYISSFIGDRLPDETVRHILESELNEDIGESIAGNHRDQVGREVLKQTPLEQIGGGKFTLSAYASSAEVSYNVVDTDEGIPIFFQTTRNIFPYDSTPSLRELNDRIQSVINVGKRGKRYVESSLMILEPDEEDDGWTVKFHQ